MRLLRPRETRSYPEGNRPFRYALSTKAAPPMSIFDNPIRRPVRGTRVFTRMKFLPHPTPEMLINVNVYGDIAGHGRRSGVGAGKASATNTRRNGRAASQGFPGNQTGERRFSDAGRGRPHAQRFPRDAGESLGRLGRGRANPSSAQRADRPAAARKIPRIWGQGI